MNIDTMLEVLRFVLGAGLVAANVAVWYGVWLERDSAPPEVQHKGWMLLVIGLAAETAIGFLVFAVDTEIGARQAAEITTAQERAANADLEAGGLGVDVKNLRGFVAKQEQEIGTQFESFQTFATIEKKRTDAVIAELTRDKVDLEKARSDALAATELTRKDLSQMAALLNQEAALRQQMIAAMAPRGLNAEQENAFVTQMKSFAGLTANVFTPQSTTPDAGPLGDLLFTLLSKSNWKVGSGVPMGGWSKFVLVCTGAHPKPNVEAAARVIVLALRAAGISAFVDLDHGPNIPLTGTGAPVADPDMTILVGAKQ